MTELLAGVRCLLFAPGDDERKLRGALSSGTDVVIADLEDAVPLARKEEARNTVSRVFAEAPRDGRRAVRIAALGTVEAEADLRLLASIDADLVVVPKADPATVGLLSGGPPAIAIVETPAGLRGAHDLASAPAVVALMLGPADLSASLGLEPRADGLELLHARSTLVLDSAAAGLAPPIDGPRLDFRDEAGLRREVELVRALGFGAKACIHPNQLRVVNAGFTDSEDRIDWARRIVAAFESSGGRATALEGTMVDEPVVARARRTLARAYAREKEMS